MTTLLMNAQIQSWMTQMAMNQVALQLITTDAEVHQNAEGTGLIGEQDYLNF